MTNRNHDEFLQLDIIARLRQLEKPDKPGLLQRFANMYFTECPKLIAQAEKAVVEQDNESLHMAAHNLKSSSAVLGAHAMSTLCRELEKLGETADFEAATGLLEQIAKVFRQTSDALRREL